MRRPLALLLAAAAALAALAGCGGKPDPESVRIFRPHGRADPTVVVFLHGWGVTAASHYRAWIDHLVSEGHVVVFPRYQTSGSSRPPDAFPDALQGIRSAFRQLHPKRVVVVGHSAGGALAADYAASARHEHLPVPEAILLAYPGRRARGVVPGHLPVEHGGHIPRRVRIVALASKRDHLVGTRTARQVVRDAGHGRVVLVHAHGATDHHAPDRSDAVSRRAFWSRLDALLAAVR